MLHSINVGVGEEGGESTVELVFPEAAVHFIGCNVIRQLTDSMQHYFYLAEWIKT